ncbi:D-alanyl-D-alanine carboxypeptidase/D-alanyl-D-alanine-endopeptidase [Streptomyces sp. HNM0574]|uniref:D-alanyl-D-alanine carboxypeptidase/D-alanyl-D-alanine endopeptidase n=1 Tax=Streptomyces sp. HNM0574 TaxID=2714954 RepID=UPI00146ACF08|nr:D-alanyl-D-alanine carboxypeptidase/D-alanyl-D-alanine-endopeptidase [Streptomyces sp. HNM0574]
MRDIAAQVRDTAARAQRACRAVARKSAEPARQRWRTATPHERQTVRLSAGSAALGLVVAVSAVAASGPWDSGQRTAERARAVAQEHGSGQKHTGDDSPEHAPRVLAALGQGKGDGADGADGSGSADGGRGSGSAGAVPPPTASALADVMEPLLDDKGLGKVRTASVVDVAAGKEIYRADPGKAVTPASTIKIATAVAALSARGEDHRLSTRVLREGDRVVLVGGGDPTLDDEDLGKLAERTADALRGSGTKKVSLGYDTSLFTGPERHPIGPNDNLAPVTALMSGQGRQGDGEGHAPSPRVDDPAADAAKTFGDRLEDQGLDVDGDPEKADGKKGGKGEELAVHRSEPLSRLVEEMLTHSDNDIAEALARQAALGSGEPASFKGAATAIERQLGKLQLPLKGAEFHDGSGLSRDDRVTASLLTRLLTTAADPDRPGLRSVLTGLPVARFTGTLDKRYEDERDRAGAGLVRAKTGTLTGVNSLAGTVVDADGRLLVFAFATSGTTDRDGAQDALDRMASALANCGCRESPAHG